MASIAKENPWLINQNSPGSYLENAKKALGNYPPPGDGKMATPSLEPNSSRGLIDHLHLHVTQTTKNRLSEPIGSLQIAKLIISREGALFENRQVVAIEAQAQLAFTLRLIQERVPRLESIDQRNAIEQLGKNPYLALSEADRLTVQSQQEKRIHELERAALREPRQRLQLTRVQADLALVQAAQGQPTIRIQLPASAVADQQFGSRDRGLDQERILQVKKELIRNGDDPSLRKWLTELRTKPAQRRNVPVDQKQLQRKGHTHLQDLHIGRLQALLQETLGPSALSAHGRRCEAQLRLIHATIQKHAPGQTPEQADAFGWMFAAPAELNEQLSALKQMRTEWRNYQGSPHADRRIVDGNIARLDRHIAYAEARLARDEPEAGRKLLEQAIAAMSEEERVRLSELVEQLPHEALVSPEGESRYYQVLSRYAVTELLSPAEKEELGRLAVSGLAQQVDAVHLSLKKLDAYATEKGLAQTEPRYAAVREDLQRCQESLQLSVEKYAEKQPGLVASLLKRLKATIPQKRGPPLDPANDRDDPRILTAVTNAELFIKSGSPGSTQPTSPQNHSNR